MGEVGNVKQRGNMKQLLSAYLLARFVFTKVNLMGINDCYTAWHQYSLFSLWYNRRIFVYPVLKNFTRYVS